MAPRLIKHNFSLIEMIVAIGILVIVAMLIGTASATFYNGYRRSIMAGERIKSYLAIDRLMDGNVRNMIPFKWTDDDTGDQTMVFEGDVDFMHFTTLRRSYSGDQGSLLFIRISLDKTTDSLIAEYSNLPFIPWEDTQDQTVSREVLTTNVESITFYYIDEIEDDFEYEETWLEEDYGDTIPLAIQLQITWKDGVTEQWLRRVAGASANSSFGSRD